MAPSTSGLGARSEPIASTAITVGMGCQSETPLLGFFHFQDFAALIVPALGAGAVGKFALVTVGALRQGVRGQMIVRPPRGRAPLRMSSFWICHKNPSVFPIPASS